MPRYSVWEMKTTTPSTPWTRGMKRVSRPDPNGLIHDYESVVGID